MTHRTPAPNLQQHRPKRRRPTTLPPPVGPSQPVSTISSSLLRQGESQITGIMPMMAPTMMTQTMTTRMGATASLCFRRKSPHRSCRNIRSLNVLEMAICGHQDTGAMPPRATTGYPALGRNRLKWATYGPPDIGEFTMAAIAITTAHGVNMSVTTVALTMDSAMAAPATRAGTGADGASTITAPSTM